VGLGVFVDAWTGSGSGVGVEGTGVGLGVFVDAWVDSGSGVGELSALCSTLTAVAGTSAVCCAALGSQAASAKTNRIIDQDFTTERKLMRMFTS